MTPGTLRRYLFGQADAVRQVAAARCWWPLGVLLVLLTAIPRNYDQTLLGERPFLWVFGPLLFSLVSGSLLFGFLHVFVLRRGVPRDQAVPRAMQQWVCFMGMFWLTVPIAWLVRDSRGTLPRLAHGHQGEPCPVEGGRCCGACCSWRAWSTW